MAFDTDTTQLDHLVKAFDFIEGFLQGRSPVLSVADKELLKRTYHANRGLDQAVAIRVVAEVGRVGGDLHHQGVDLEEAEAVAGPGIGRHRSRAQAHGADGDGGLEK